MAERVCSGNAKMDGFGYKCAAYGRPWTFRKEGGLRLDCLGLLWSLFPLNVLLRYDTRWLVADFHHSSPLASLSL